MYAGGTAAKFSVRIRKEVKLKYRVIERFRKEYSMAAMCKVFEASHSGYYAWRTLHDREPKVFYPPSYKAHRLLPADGASCNPKTPR